MTTQGDAIVRDAVRDRYARAAQNAFESCCAPSTSSCCDDSYDSAEIEVLPETVTTASLGCGNPTALDTLREGEVVLDLGSGGGIDVFLAAQRIGETGRAIGLDMTPEMIALARKNAERVGARNVECIEGEIEDIPLPAEVQANVEFWAACVGGAWGEADYLGAVRAAGFTSIDVMARTPYPVEGLDEEVRLFSLNFRAEKAASEGGNYGEV